MSIWKTIKTCIFKKEECKRPLQVIHSNVWGPTRTASLAGNSYYVTFIDDHIRKMWLYSMKAKSKVFYHFKHLKNMAEKETRMQIECLRSNGGGEYFSNELAGFLMSRESRGILHAAIPHNRMVQQKGRTDILLKLQGHS